MTGEAVRVHGKCSTPHAIDWQYLSVLRGTTDAISAARFIEVKKNTVSMATFVYDGDGRRVKSTINGTTTTFVGTHYEVAGSTVTKYYFANT